MDPPPRQSSCLSNSMKPVLGAIIVLIMCISPVVHDSCMCASKLRTWRIIRFFFFNMFVSVSQFAEAFVYFKNLNYLSIKLENQLKNTKIMQKKRIQELPRQWIGVSFNSCFQTSFSVFIMMLCKHSDWQPQLHRCSRQSPESR